MGLKKLIKIFHKINILSGLARGKERGRIKGFIKNPPFYFGVLSFVLFSVMFASCDSYALNSLDGRAVFLNSFFDSGEHCSDSLFFTQSDKISLETPDLKIVQGNTLSGISAPNVVSAKTLGDVFGASLSNKKDISEYVVQPGDTFQTIAQANGISVSTLLWANDLSSSSVVKVGQTLVILSTDGVLHVVKSGDSISAISQKYTAKQDDIIAFNSLANKDDIYIGDILVVPGGSMPKKSAPVANNQVPLADNYFIFPVQGQISQGLHYYNAVDIRNKCGTPIYAAAAGVVQRAVANGGYNLGMGNHITILHSNGTVTYYGHLMTVLVKPGDKVDVGQNIALVGGQPGMAGAGKSTGCHLHFQVVGAKNPLTKYGVGASISYK